MHPSAACCHQGGNTHRAVFPAILALLLAIGAVPPTLAADRSEAIDRYLGFCESARATLIDAGTCPHDPIVIGPSIATNPEGLARFVREKIAYEPSAGSNRGPEGSLAALTGSDWDRALLLGALLTSAGYSPRYVELERTPSEAAEMVDAFLTCEPLWKGFSPDSIAPSTVAREPLALLAEFGIATDTSARHQAKAATLWKTILDESTGAIDRLAPRLESALQAAGLDTVRPFDAWRKDLLQAARSRVLVEIDDGEQPVVLLPGPEATLPPADVLTQAPRLENPPDDRKTTIHLEVVLETTRPDGTLATTTVFQWENPIDPLFMHPARLEIVPVNLAATEPAHLWSPRTWVEQLAAMRQFQVVLRQGDQTLASPMFDRTGTVTAVADEGQHAATANLGAGAGGLFAGGLGGGEEAEPPEEPAAITAIPFPAPPAGPTAAGSLRAITLGLELREPGRPTIRQRRFLVGDLRPGLTPVFTADLLACGGPISPLSVSWMTLDTVTRNAPVLGRVLASDDPHRLEEAEDLQRMPTLLHHWLLGRQALAARLLQADRRLGLQVRPTLVLLTNQLRPDPTAQGARMRVAIDLLTDGLTLLPRVNGAEKAAFAANLRLGMAATALETSLLKRRLPPPGPRGPLEVWEATATPARNPIAVRPSTDGSTGSVTPAPLAAWGIRNGETDRTLVFPAGATPGVWWSIDPADGRAIGRGEGGEGLSMMEYCQLLKLNLSNLKCNLAFMSTILGGDRDEAAKDWLGCMTGADNPGSYANWAGSAVDCCSKTIEWGGTLANIGDALAGAWDLAEAIQSMRGGKK